MRFVTTQALPGVVPVMGVSAIDSAPLLDPSYYSLITDFGPGPLEVGAGTHYHMPVSRVEHARRAWLARGWEHLNSLGSIQLVREGPVGTFTLTPVYSFDETTTGFSVPTPLSLSKWAQFAGASNPTRAFAYEGQVLGANEGGNVTTASGETLNWNTPVSGTSWVEVYRENTGEVAYSASDHPTYPAIGFDFVLEVKLYANSGCVRVGSQYYSVFQMDVRARWEPSSGELLPSYLDAPDPDADAFYPAQEATASTLFDSVTINECGTVSFDGATGAPYNAATFEDGPGLGNTSTAWGSGPLLPAIDLAFTFQDPFFWQIPAA